MFQVVIMIVFCLVSMAGRHRPACACAFLLRVFFFAAFNGEEPCHMYDNTKEQTSVPVVVLAPPFRLFFCFNCEDSGGEKKYRTVLKCCSSVDAEVYCCIYVFFLPKLCVCSWWQVASEAAALLVECKTSFHPFSFNALASLPLVPNPPKVR